MGTCHPYVSKGSIVLYLSLSIHLIIYLSGHSDCMHFRPTYLNTYHTKLLSWQQLLIAFKSRLLWHASQELPSWCSLLNLLKGVQCWAQQGMPKENKDWCSLSLSEPFSQHSWFQRIEEEGTIDPEGKEALRQGFQSQGEVPQEWQIPGRWPTLLVPTKLKRPWGCFDLRN